MISNSTTGEKKNMERAVLVTVYRGNNYRAGRNGSENGRRRDYIIVRTLNQRSIK